MITVLIIVCLILFAPACIGPLLVSEKTTDLAQINAYRIQEANPCSEDGTIRSLRK
jgi:hypothetical protein